MSAPTSPASGPQRQTLKRDGFIVCTGAAPQCFGLAECAAPLNAKIGREFLPDLISLSSSGAPNASTPAELYRAHVLILG